MNTNVTISEEARTLAEKRAKERGFQSVDDYVEALIRGDQNEAIFEEWMRAEVEEGFASGQATELTPSLLHELVQDGISRAKTRASK
ncbi:MAG: hypothetical protein KGO48_11905 [Alphaproteobacteria bacterium]|nr:hypothetical protein [Alphaproteobacteria bacterium]